MRQKTFTFRGVELEYLNHRYNHASRNMRSIEVPIVMRYLRQFDPRRVLEVGNVLRHYVSPCTWACVDANERAKGVYNRDVMTWEPKKRWDLLVSISTVEHIGHGRYQHITYKPYTQQEIFEKLLTFLSPNGSLAVTFPLNYNHELDTAIMDGSLPVNTHFARRLNADNEWEETDMDTAFSIPYGKWRWGSAMALLTAGRDAWL